MNQPTLIEQQRHQILSERVAQLEAVIREQELTIQRESSARAMAVEQARALRRKLAARKPSPR